MVMARSGYSPRGLVHALRGAGLDAQLVRDGGASIDLVDVQMDSRECHTGDLFACVVGRRHDGHDHAADAVAAGAVALLVERELAIDVPQIIVDSVRRAVGPIAAILHGRPSTRATVIGITGTNGKTTVASMVAAVVSSAGTPTTVIGTLSGRLTTPEAPDLQRQLAASADDGRTVIMEVSSHALVEHRVLGIDFAVAAFTNLSRDHLDLHGSMEEYFRAKASLFTECHPRYAVVNVGDRYGRLLADTLEVDESAQGASLRRVSFDDVSTITLSPEGSSFELDQRRWSIPVIGRPHVENAIVAIGICRALGLADEVIAKGLASMPPVPGRLERIAPNEPRAIDVIVDFAHTPDALEALIATCREIAPGRRLVLVFGCGGDRDRTKRPEMGRIAAGADRVLVTSDNPRSEDPTSITTEILGGIGADDLPRVDVVVDRATAIQQAIESALDGDVVVIAGRGHESMQEVAGIKVPFDDREVARLALGDCQ
jgi:UDP-N-acetylmuramoyl-L-alanyl-D-glutamate--2,6-diaminopimelate ligase